MCYKCGGTFVEYTAKLEEEMKKAQGVLKPAGNSKKK